MKLSYLWRFIVLVILLLPLAQNDYLDVLASFYIAAIVIIFRKFSDLVKFLGTFVTSLSFFTINLIWLYNVGYYYQITALIVILSFLYTIPILFLHQKRYLLFVTLWLTLDLIMLHSKTGFPLIQLCHHAAFLPELIQFSKIFGSLGINLFLLLLNILITLLFVDKYSKVSIYSILSAIFFLQVLNCLMLYNYPLDRRGKRLKVLTLNTNLECPEEKYSKDADELCDIYNSKISKFKYEDIDLIIFPETAFDSLSALNEVNSNEIIANIRSSNSGRDYIIGSVLYEDGHQYSNGIPNGLSKMGLKRLFFYNSSICISGNKFQIRHKNKLVPFNEFIPKEISYFFPKNKVIAFRHFRDIDNMTLPFQTKKSKIGAAICYESLFGFFISKFVLNGANLLVFQYNEGWYHSLYGSRKMLANACLRASEQNKFVVNSSNCGYSSIINNRGHVVRVSHDDTDILGEIRLNSKITPYTFFSDFIGWLSLIYIALIGLLHIWKKQ